MTAALVRYLTLSSLCSPQLKFTKASLSRPTPSRGRRTRFHLGKITEGVPPLGTSWKAACRIIRTGCRMPGDGRPQLDGKPHADWGCMTISGKKGASALLSGQLDQRALVRLCGDVLFARGHLNIRCTDGPGDGGRDVHSLDRQANRHLAQCKFHEDPGKACSSADLSELPMAMTKLGYSRGTFVTNGRITPQGKREYLDSYPKLELEFLDGDSLSEEVLANPLLRVVWFDGQSIVRVNNAVIIPIIARSHDRDVPIHPLRYFNSPNPETASTFLAQRYPDLKFSLRDASAKREAFEPYRPPIAASMEEGMASVLRVMEVIAEGDILLSQISDVSRDVCKATLGWLGETIDGLTVRSGEARIGKAAESTEDTRFFSGAKGHSLIQTSQSGGEERAWFEAVPLDGWSNDTDARVTEADWIRVYCVDADFCVSYEIECPAGADLKAQRNALRQITLEGWRKSIFCLHPPWQAWAAPISAPDETVLWPWDGRILCGWFHRNLLGGPVLIPSEREEQFMEAPSEEAEGARLTKIRDYLMSAEGVEVIDPRKARHMVALVGNDPLEEEEHVRYRTAEVTTFPDDLPSPIDPRSRRFGFSVAWAVKAEQGACASFVKERLESCGIFDVATAVVESLEEFVALTVQLKPLEIGTQPTTEILCEIRREVEGWLATVGKARHVGVATGTMTCYPS